MKPSKVFAISIGCTMFIIALGYALCFLVSDIVDGWRGFSMALEALFVVWWFGGLSIVVGGCIYVGSNRIRRKDWRYWLAALAVPFTLWVFISMLYVDEMYM